MKQIVFAVLAFFAVAIAANAQQGTADVRGRVVDSSMAAMPGVAVVVRNQDNGQFRETVSSPDGSFFLSAMSPGVYRVEAMIEGFRPYVRADVRLEVGRTTTVEVPLEVGGLSEVLTVTGEAPLVDTSSKELGGHVAAEEFLEVPSFNRDFTGVLAMLPGVVAVKQTTTFGAAIEAGGQNSRNVTYMLDGADNNDALSRGSQGSQARVPLEAIQEFKLLTSQFDAEFGSTSGGVVNAVTKQGSNLFHGSFFEFFQDQRLTAKEYFVKQKGLAEAPTKQNQFGGTVGGPILKDKAHFFFSLERIILDQGFTMNVPSRPDLNRTDFGISRVWNTFIRFDNQINSANTWGVRWLRDSSPQPLQLTSTWTHMRGGAELDLDQTMVGTLSSVIGSTKVNTFKVTRVSENLTFGNPIANYNGIDQTKVPPALNYASFQDGGSIEASIRDLYSYIADDVFSWFVPNKAGDHELKFGINFNNSPLHLQNYQTGNGLFTFANDLAFNAADPRTYPERLSIRVPGKSDFETKATYVGVFAQDKWKVSNKATLSLGLRYDLEVLKTPNGENPLFAGRSEQYPLDLNNISPRMGMSYVLDGEGKSVLRGGVGLFYQQTGLTFVNPMFTDGRNSTSFLVNYPTNNIDPGPRSGQFPTDPRLVNGPVVNYAAILSLFPPAGTPQRNTGTVRFDNPDRTVPYARQYSIGYQTQVGDSMSVSADVVRSESRDQYMLKDLNPPVRATGLATGAVTRTNPLVGTVGEFATRVDTLVNAGYINYTSLQLAVTKRPTHGVSARVSYSYSKGRGNTATGQADTVNSQFLNDLRLDTDEGPTSSDRPHILSASSNIDVPKTGGLRVSVVVQARSGLPFSLINSANDADRNGITTNEYLTAGTYSGTGLDAISVDYAGGRNGARNKTFASVDLRMGYSFRLPGGRTVDAHVDVFNLTDAVDYVAPAGDLRTPATFLRYTAVQGATRSAQLNFRYGF